MLPFFLNLTQNFKKIWILLEIPARETKFSMVDRILLLLVSFLASTI